MSGSWQIEGFLNTPACEKNLSVLRSERWSWLPHLFLLPSLFPSSPDFSFSFFLSFLPFFLSPSFWQVTFVRKGFKNKNEIGCIYYHVHTQLPFALGGQNTHKHRAPNPIHQHGLSRRIGPCIFFYHYLYPNHSSSHTSHSCHTHTPIFVPYSYVKRLRVWLKSIRDT